MQSYHLSLYLTSERIKRVSLLKEKYTLYNSLELVHISNKIKPLSSHLKHKTYLGYFWLCVIWMRSPWLLGILFWKRKSFWWVVTSWTHKSEYKVKKPRILQYKPACNKKNKTKKNAKGVRLKNVDVVQEVFSKNLLTLF